MKCGQKNGLRVLTNGVYLAAESAPRSATLGSFKHVLYYGFYDLDQNQLDLLKEVRRRVPVRQSGGRRCATLPPCGHRTMSSSINKIQAKILEVQPNLHGAGTVAADAPGAIVKHTSNRPIIEHHSLKCCEQELPWPAHRGCISGPVVDPIFARQDSPIVRFC